MPSPTGFQRNLINVRATPTPSQGNSELQNGLFNDDELRMIHYFQMPDTDTITTLGIHIAEHGPGTNQKHLKIGIQSIAANGQPTGTWRTSIDYYSNGSSATGLQTFSLSPALTLNRGEYYAVVIESISGHTTNNYTYVSSVRNGVIQSGLPYTIRPDFFIEYRGEPFVVVRSAANSYSIPLATYPTQEAFNQTTEQGFKFNLNPSVGSRFTLRGVKIYADLSLYNATINMNLYDSDGTTILDTITLDTDLPADLQNVFHTLYFDGTFLPQIYTNKNYYIGFTTNSSTSMFLNSYEVYNIQDWGYITNHQFTYYRKNNNIISEFNTKRIIVELILEDVSGMSVAYTNAEINQQVTAGVTSRTEFIYLNASGYTFNTAGLSASYIRSGSTRTSITLASQTVSGAWISGGFVEVDLVNMPGLYRFDVPDAIFTAGVKSAAVEIINSNTNERVIITYNFLETMTLDFTQAVPLSNNPGTIGDALNAARATGFGKWVISGNTMNLYGPDNVTVIKTFTLDSGSAPKSRS
jgi:hypothetical protein